MLDRDRAHELLRDGAKYSDEEIDMILQSLYAIAEVHSDLVARNTDGCPGTMPSGLEQENEEHE